MSGNIEKVGEWDRVRLAIMMLKKEAQKSKSISLKRTGLFAEGEAKKHVSRQDLNWKPLNKEYLRRKKKRGLSNKILVATSTYFQSITSFVDMDTAYAGVRRVSRYKDGKSVANIAKIHEYGSKERNIPARPLWRPTFHAARKYWFEKANAALIFKTRMKKYGL